MKLKVGDKLVCKTRTNGLSEFIINEYYQVMQISTQFLTIRCGSSFSWRFFLHNDNDIHRYYIWDYFYKPQEVRKFKLDKLNEI